MSDRACLLYFDDEAPFALKLAHDAGLRPALIQRHRFPDGELKLRLPPHLPSHVVLVRSLANPNEKLVELLLVARTARGRMLNASAWKHLGLTPPATQAQLPLLDEDE